MLTTAAVILVNMVNDSLTRPRWNRITPDRFVVGALAVVALLWLSERFGWFTLDHHKGWAVLIAVAAFTAALLALVLWFVAALLFRRRFQFGIRALLLLALIVALLSGWMTVKMRAAKEQHDAVEAIGATIYDFQHSHSCVAADPEWLRNILGNDFFHDVVVAYLKNDSGMKHLKGLSQLQELCLSGEAVTDAGMENIKGLIHLQSVEARCTTITDSGLRCLPATSVRRLCLCANHDMTSAVWADLQHLPQLTDLDLEQMSVTNDDLQKLAQLHNLRALSLEYCGITDSGLKRLTPLAQLESLKLTYEGVTDAGIEHLRAFTKLRSLDLQETGITVAGLEPLKALSQLESLSLDSHLLTAAGVEHLKAVPRLNELSLFHASDEDLENLQDLSQLRTLNLTNPNTTDECLKQFQQVLPNCKVNLIPAGEN